MAVEMPNVEMSGFVDLKPDSALLDANFDGYKLSLETFPIFSAPLPSKVRIMQTSNAQYGLEHVKLFGDINYLINDPFDSSHETKRFYTIADDLHIYCIRFNKREKKFSSIEIVATISLPTDAENREERYPTTLSFADQNTAVVANGYGLLSMYITGDRSTNIAWTECLNIKPLLHDDDSGAFIIAESRRSSASTIDVLLRSIIAKERPSSKSHFWNKLFWLTISTSEGEAWHISHAREVTCEGHVEMATFDSTLNNLIVASCGVATFTADSSSTVTRSPNTSLAEDESGQIVQEPMEEDTKKSYVWMQDKDDVMAVFSVADAIRKTDVSMSLTASNIRLAINNTLLIEGRLGGSVDTNASTYTLDNNKLELTLSKSSAAHWNELVIGDQRGTYQEDRDSLIATAEFIERFFANSQADAGGGGNQSFNTEQLEDCDMNDEEIYKIRWLSADTHTAKYTSDITGHNVLFSVSLGLGPRCICLRMDVDGILWALDCCDDNPAVHKATFQAFGYVQASKTQRKFCSCSPDCSYAVIVEDKRHAFVYWQPAPISSDLRNRESGRRIGAIAKQNLVSLLKTDAAGDQAVVTDNIVGLYAGNNALFVLTTSDLFVIILK